MNDIQILLDNERELQLLVQQTNEIGKMYVQKLLLEKDKIISKLFMSKLNDDQLQLFKKLIEEEQNERSNKNIA